MKVYATQPVFPYGGGAAEEVRRQGRFSINTKYSK